MSLAAVSAVLRRMPRFRSIVVICVIALAAMLGVRVSLAWYVSSGRAAARIEAAMIARLGGTARVTDLTMPRWLVVEVGAVDATLSNGVRIAVADARVRATVFGLLRRRVTEVSARDVQVQLPAGPVARPGVTSGAQTTKLPTFERVHVGRLAVDRLRASGETERLAQLSMEAAPERDGAYLTTLTASVPRVDLQVTGTIRYRVGRVRPDDLDLTFSVDWGKLLALAATGELTGSGTLTGTATLDAGVLTFRLERPALRWNALELGPGACVIAARPESMVFPVPMDVTFQADHARYGDIFVAPGAIEVRGKAAVGLLARRVTWSDIELEWDAGAVLRCDGAASLATSGGSAHLALPDLPLAVWAEYAPALRRLMGSGTALGGDLGAVLALDWTPSMRTLTADCRWTGGSIMRSDFRQAAGLDVALHLTAHAPDEGALTVHASGMVRAGEVLWDSFYKDVGAHPIPLELDARIPRSSPALEDLRLGVDLDALGQWWVAGDVPLAPYDLEGLRVVGEAIEVSAVVEDLVVPLLAESRPWSADLRGRGIGVFSAAVLQAGECIGVRGRLQLQGITVEAPTAQLYVRDLNAQIPFRLGPGPTPTPDETPQLGLIEFAAAHAGPVPLDGGRLPVQVWDNTAVVAAPYTTELFGGEFTIDGMWGRNLFTSDRHWEAEVRMRNVDLAAAATAFEVLPIDGVLSGHLDRLRFAGGDIETTGALEATVYDGVLRVTGMGAQDVVSPYRTLTADLTWEGINLARVTEALEFGRITGILNGRVRGLKIQAGQPAAFEAEFKTVRTPGVPQTISIEAVNKISVLGTGRGITATLSRGISSLFQEFRYRQIGFYSYLENDRFLIGGVLGPDAEYFVRGTVMPPRINVINRDPRRLVDFADMVQRVRALQLPTSGETPASLEGAES